jgi:hypothetical protein
MADRYQYRPESADDRGARRAASQSADGDPLAELARLIGQTEQGTALSAPPSTRAERTRADRVSSQQYQPQHEDVPDEAPPAEASRPSWMRTASRQQRAQPAALEPQGYSADPYPQQDEEPPPPAFLRTARHRDERQQQPQQAQYDQYQYQREQQYAEQTQYEQQPQYDHQHDQQARYDHVLYDQNSQNAHYPQYQDQQYADGTYQAGYQEQDPNYPPYYGDGHYEEPQRKRGGLMTVAAVLALAVVGTAGAFAYRSFVGSPRSGEPPVIKAEPGATKIVPPTQTSDASGKIVDRIGAPSGQEQLLSREEQPVDINGRNPPRVVFPPLNTNANPPSPQSVATTTASTPPRAGVSNGALGDEPRRVRTLSIRTDQPDTAPASGQQGQAAQSRAASARAQAPANAPVSLSPQQQAPAPTRTASAQPTGGSGGYMVQISSQRSEADAQAAYRAMQSKFPNVLGSRSAMIRRADLGERGIYYRALVGPFSQAEDAGQLCNSLKAAGGQCVVQRN